MAVIGINYKGCDHDYDPDGNIIEIDPSHDSYLKYESVYLYYGEDKIFNSGNFIKDWFDATAFYFRNLADNEQHLSMSSSCDHFFFDGANFDSAYLVMTDDKPILKYVNKSDEHWFISQRDIFEGGIEFFVEAGTKPTWEELKEICK